MIAPIMALAGTDTRDHAARELGGERAAQDRGGATKKIARNAVTSAKVKRNSLTGADIRESTLAQVRNAPHAAVADSATNTGSANSANAVNLAGKGGL